MRYVLFRAYATIYVHVSSSLPQKILTNYEDRHFLLPSVLEMNRVIFK